MREGVQLSRAAARGPALATSRQSGKAVTSHRTPNLCRLCAKFHHCDAIRLSYDSTPLRPVRVEVRSTLRDTWINMGQFVNPNVRSFFFDIGPTNDMRFYRLSIDP